MKATFFYSEEQLGRCVAAGSFNFGSGMFKPYEPHYAPNGQEYTELQSGDNEHKSNFTDAVIIHECINKREYSEWLEKTLS